MCRLSWSNDSIACRCCLYRCGFRTIILVSRPSNRSKNRTISILGGFSVDCLLESALLPPSSYFHDEYPATPHWNPLDLAGLLVWISREICHQISHTLQESSTLERQNHHHFFDSLLLSNHHLCCSSRLCALLDSAFSNPYLLNMPSRCPLT